MQNSDFPHVNQMNEPAEPIAKGIIPTAKQAFGDLFHWKQRVEVVNEDGESRFEWQSPPALKNPFAPVTQLSFRAWVFFFAGFIAWVADAYDFHALSIQTTKLAKYFSTTNTKISEAITLTLLLRSVGAAFFGVAGDKFGRKWPMVLNMFILGKNVPFSRLSPRLVLILLRFSPNRFHLRWFVPAVSRSSRAFRNIHGWR